MKKITIMHLSDLHYGSPSAFQDDAKTDVRPSVRANAFGYLHEMLDEYFCANPPSAIAITGDITTQGASSGFEEFESSTAAKMLSLVKDPRAICAVPGNHDIEWGRSPTDPSYFTSKFALYKQCVSRLGVTSALIPCGEMPESSTKPIEFETNIPGPLFVDDARRLIIICINSSLRCGESNEALLQEFSMPIASAMGVLKTCGDELSKIQAHRIKEASLHLESLTSVAKRYSITDVPHVTDAQLGKIRAALEREKARLGSKWKSYIVVGMLHHHVVPFRAQRTEHKPFEILLDASAVLEFLAAFGCQIILTGHKHQAYSQQLTIAGTDMLVVGGSTVGGYPIPGSEQGIRQLTIWRDAGSTMVEVVSLSCGRRGDLRTDLRRAIEHGEKLALRDPQAPPGAPPTGRPPRPFEAAGGDKWVDNIPSILSAIRSRHSSELIIQHTWFASWLEGLAGKLEDAIRESDIRSIRLMLPGDLVLSLRAASRTDVREKSAREQLRHTTLGFVKLVKRINRDRAVNRRISLCVEQYEYLIPGPLIQVGGFVFAGLYLPLVSSDYGPFISLDSGHWLRGPLTGAWSETHRSRLFKPVPSQFLTESVVSSVLGGNIARILDKALEAACPRRAVARELSCTDAFVSVGDVSYSTAEVKRVVVLALGKAAVPMAESALDRLAPMETKCIVVTKASHMTNGRTINGGAPILGNHPDPGADSVVAGEKIMKVLEELRDGDLLLCLLSGGGSALAVVPTNGLTEKDLALIGTELRDASATIQQTNAVRSQLDKLKGGGILRMALEKGARVATIALSDVPCDDNTVIASGPTLPPSATPTHARDVLKTLDLDRLASLVDVGLRSRTEFEFPHGTCFRVAARNQDVVNAALIAANKEGMRGHVFLRNYQGEASELGARIGKFAAAIAAGNKPDEGGFGLLSEGECESLANCEQSICLIAGGEASVKRNREEQALGKGGRTFEMALSIAQALDKSRGVTVVVIATDGDDGNSGSGGAVASSSTMWRASKLKRSIDQYRASRESYLFFEELDDALDHGPTETNVNDLVLVFIER